MPRHPHVSAEVAESPWVRIAADAAREWRRDNPRPSPAAFDTWVYRDLEPAMLAGMGVPAARRELTVAQRDALDAIHVGLVEDPALREWLVA